MNNGSTVESGLYNASANIGSVTSIIYLVIGIIVGVICLISAIYNFSSTPQTIKIKVNGKRIPTDSIVDGRRIPTDSIVNGETETTTSDPIVMGIVSLIAAILIVGLSYGNYYLTENYKGYAALEGAETTINAVKSL
jgi:hypothetical protein